MEQVVRKWLVLAKKAACRQPAGQAVTVSQQAGVCKGIQGF